MTIPAYCIKIYNPSDVLRYTFSNDTSISGALNDASNITSTTRLTDNIGTFSFLLTTKKAALYKFYDIAGHDKVKIWYGYDTIDDSADPQFAGRIYHISAPFTSESGFHRVVKGRDYGEILNRRFKGYTVWSTQTIPAIVTDLANDIGLEGDGSKRDATPADTINMRVEVDQHETYLKLLQNLSDYWISAGTQCKKDFYVDVDGDLVWKGRPIRTSGVESFSVGADIISYNVLRELESVRNKIWVYGKDTKPYPVDTDGQTWSDTLTEDLTDIGDVLEHSLGDWKCATGNTTLNILTQTAEAVGPVAGTYLIEVDASAYNYYTQAYFDFDTVVNANMYPELSFSVYMDGNHDTHRSGFVILKDSSANEAFASFYNQNIDVFEQKHFNIGERNEGTWKPESGFDWTDIAEVHIAVNQDASQYGEWYLDKFFFGGRRWQDLAEDSTSQTNYGIREMVLVDEELNSDGECQSRGEALLYQLKDVPIRLDIEVLGNTNVLIGDQLTMTIPAENISAASYDVVSVTHVFMPKPIGFRTYANMINSSDRRALPPRTRDELIFQKVWKQLKATGRLKQNMGFAG